MKAAKTRALHRHKGAAPVHHHAAAHKPAAKSKAAPKAKKAQPKRTAAQVKAARARAWSPGDVACCSAEALAASLRLAGWLVDPAEVLALYRRTAGTPDAGASLLVTLEAAAEYGLAGYQWPSVSRSNMTPPIAVRTSATDQVMATAFWDMPASLVRPVRFDQVEADDPAAVILGLELPEAPHAVTLDPSGAVWSWGGLWELTGEAVIDEAWAVEWPLA